MLYAQKQSERHICDCRYAHFPNDRPWHMNGFERRALI